jgi:Fic family protein
MAYFYQHLDADIQKILLNQIRNLWTHYSTSLEGNSLTLGETDFILEEGLTIQGKPLKDHNEVYGHAKAIELIYALLNDVGQITQQDIFQLHAAILTERIIDIDQPVGKWKKQANFTNYVNEDNKQVWREYPAPENIEKLMQQWLGRLNQSLVSKLNADDALLSYADLHLSFVTIHPFFDGNGRMARLLANLPVLKAGFAPIVVPQQDRFRYKRYLSVYQNTIAELATLNDLNALHDNQEKQRFIVLCQEYWAETLALVAEAEKIQAYRYASVQL